ncbi:hypothetical protein GCM10027277_00680 [Pseudoduganella ginsengisoli]|uniref:DUF4214 domain-containing protein n=1 Tax=Pseudoduganella ginsengisoli TaxID=1462440 RepID=A0A6L6Q307_9BURK|nr:DUF4214 domain-containing protein [Pseudoduganella ginsengisoli]MTW03866.1 DUF4214 domain-containing protein [Pseudoduganella ginsengisoli]
MWNVAIKYDDPQNFLADKSLFSGAIQSVVDYLNTFIAGSATLDLTVQVSQTSTGRFAGGGEVYTESSAGGLNYVIATAARELAGGPNKNAGSSDLTIYVDPTSSYFQSLSFDTNPYLAPRKVPAGQTDGQTVLLHEIMHGLGITSYRNYSTGVFSGNTRTLLDKYTVQSGASYLLAAPTFAQYGVQPVEVTSTSVSQNYAHLANLNNVTNGYVDDLMNGLYFYLGNRYYMGQLDLMLLRDLGYSVTIPETLPLSYSSLTGRGQVTPTATTPGAAALAGNLVTVSGTAAPGALTSVLEHNKVLGSTTAGADGHWTLTVVTDPSQASSAVVARDGSHAMDSALLALGRGSGALHLYASDLYTAVQGGGGNDVVTPGERTVRIDGGGGTDTVEYSGVHSAYGVTVAGNAISVTDALGTDVLTSVERLKFSDVSVAFDTAAGVAGQAYRIYQAAFDRLPDLAGVGYWIAVMDQGATLREVAAGFVQSTEFQARYGSHPTNAELVTHFYENVLHRAPEQSGYQYWLNVLDNNQATAAEVLAYFADSPENVAAVAAVIGNGYEYVPYS